MSEPADSKLYNKVKKRINKDIPKHSAYRSGLIVKQYKKEFKKKYGDIKPYIGKKTKKGLTRWFLENWENQRGETGYKFKSDIYRPTKRITSKTPTTFSELSKKELERARREKRKKGRVNKF
jgi:hypothetical protein